MKNLRVVLDAQTQVNLRGVSQHIEVAQFEGHSGISFLRFTQPAHCRSELDEPDMVVIDEDAQLALYVHLSKKFAAH